MKKILLLAALAMFAVACGKPQVQVLSKGLVFPESTDAPWSNCHASTLAWTPEGLAAAWFGGGPEGDPNVKVWFSRLIDGQWTAPAMIAEGKDADKAVACWNPVLWQAPGGPLRLFYKAGPRVIGWWGETKASADGGKTWSEAERLPDGFIGPVKNKPFLSSDGVLICPSSMEYPDESWKLHFEFLPPSGAVDGKDLSRTGELEDPKDLRAIQPAILDHGKGRLQALARSRFGGLVTTWSSDNGRTWGPVEKTGTDNPNSGIDAVTLRDGRHLLVYNDTPVGEGQWTGRRSPISVAISHDGITWEKLLDLDALADGEKGELSYPAVIQAPDGLVHISYTFSRRSIRHVVLKVE